LNAPTLSRHHQELLEFEQYSLTLPAPPAGSR
jgi:hypothetical protein